MAAPQIQTREQVIPTKDDFKKLLTAKTHYEEAQKGPDNKTWERKHFNETPWGIAWKTSVDPRAKAGNSDKALRYFIAAVAIDWQALIAQLKTTLRKWGYDSANLKTIAGLYWHDEVGLQFLVSCF